MKKIKCVLVGDSIAEKTQLLFCYTGNSPTGESAPTVFANYKVKIMYEDNEIGLFLWDTAGQESLNNIRVLSYTNTDVFVIVFSLVHSITLQNVFNTWIPEIKENCPDIPYILVGTKKDIRDNFEKNREEYSSKGYEPIKTSIGIETKEKIQAEEYIECDTDDIDSIRPIFNSAIKCVFDHENQQLEEEKNEKNKKKKLKKKKKSENQVETNQTMDETKLIKDDDLIKIGFIGDEKSGKKEIAFKYIYDNFISDETTTDVEDFYKIVETTTDDENFDKIVEVYNVIRKLKIEIDFPYDFSEIHGFILIFNGNDENSLYSLKEMLDSQQELGVELNPCILVANYGNKKIKKKKKIPETVQKLINDFKCQYFEINSTFNDIESAFYSLFKLIPKSSVVGKKVKRKKKEKKVIKKRRFIKPFN